MSGAYDYVAEPEIIEVAAASGPFVVAGLETTILEEGAMCLLVFYPEEMFFRALCLEAGRRRLWRRTTGSPKVAKLWWERVLGLELSEWGLRRFEEIAEGIAP